MKIKLARLKILTFPIIYICYSRYRPSNVECVLSGQNTRSAIATRNKKGRKERSKLIGEDEGTIIDGILSIGR